MPEVTVEVVGKTMPNILTALQYGHRLRDMTDSIARYRLLSATIGGKPAPGISVSVCRQSGRVRVGGYSGGKEPLRLRFDVELENLNRCPMSGA